MKKRDPGNAFAKHLALYHPEAQGDISNFTIKVLSTFKKPLPRQKTEAVIIHDSKVDHLMNSKAEQRQPAIHRVIHLNNFRHLSFVCPHVDLHTSILPDKIWRKG